MNKFLIPLLAAAVTPAAAACPDAFRLEVRKAVPAGFAKKCDRCDYSGTHSEYLVRGCFTMAQCAAFCASDKNCVAFDYGFSGRAGECFINSRAGQGTVGHSSFSAFTKNDAWTNLARQATSVASQSTTIYGGVASRAIDGNMAGDWRSKSVTHTGQRYGSFWQVDLGAEYEIHNVRILGRQDDCCFSRDTGLAAYTGTRSWNGAPEGKPIGVVGGSPQRQLCVDYRVTGAARRARYVVIALPKNRNSVLSLAEVEVFGRKLSTAGGDLLQGKPVTASSVWRDLTEAVGAQYAVDGLEGTRWASNSGCSASRPCWLEINLGANCRVTTVEIDWERAFAVRYTVQVLGPNGKTVCVTDGKLEKRSIPMGDALGSKVRIEVTHAHLSLASIWSVNAVGLRD